MISTFKITLILLTTLLLSCSPERPVARKSNVQSESISQLRPNATLITYENQTTEQIENGRRVATFRSPRAEELTLQYWRQKWKGHKQQLLNVNGEGSSTNIPLLQLRALDLGMSVIYDRTTEQVIKVVQHEKN